MVLSYEITFCASFIHKRSGQVLDLQKTIKKEFDENEETFKQLCGEYEEEVGFKREENKDKFDRLLLERLSETEKETSKEIIDKMIESFKTSCGKDCNGYLQFGGWVLNIRDFSGILIKDFNIKISKH